VRHRTRAGFRKGSPVHVTLRVRREAAGLRRRRQYQAIRRAMLRTGHRAGFRICHYSIQGNHFHLICEALDRTLLARGVQGFSSLVARRINQLVGRTGKVFDDRYHFRALSTPREVRNALCYVLNNWRRHGEHVDHPRWKLDPFSSADLFDGWTGWHGERHMGGTLRPGWLPEDEPIPIARPQFWLLTDGWRRRGLLRPDETPGPRSA
jgi:REP element-mobilizing transposase RayT